MEGRGSRSNAHRHRRLRQDHVRGPRSRGLLAAEVRGRGAPGPARAQDRGTGPHPYFRRDCVRAARGRPRRGRAQAGGPRDQGLDLHRTWWSERQHHLLGDPYHAQTQRPGGEHPGREVAAAKQGEGAARPPCPPLRDEAGGTAGVDQGAAARHGAQRQSVRKDPHLQLQGQSGHGPSHQLDPAQARPRHGRRPGRSGLGSDRCGTGGPAQRRKSFRQLTIVEVLKLSADYIQKHGSDSSRLDAELLLAHALQLRRLDLYLKFDHQLTQSELSAYRALVARRAKGEPVAYLVGHKEFMGLDFEVTPDVLVPNPDTEVLVQRAVDIARESPRPIRVADVGTGSGCIAIAIAHYAPNADVWASDVSRPALEVAARNVARHGVGERVDLERGDLMHPLVGEFDLVCANLPYVAVGATLPAEVLAQPALALRSESGGAALVARLLDEAPARLQPGGRLLAELDPAILAAATESAARNFAGHRLLRDIGGRERVIEAWSFIPTNSEPSA